MNLTCLINGLEKSNLNMFNFKRVDLKFKSLYDINLEKPRSDERNQEREGERILCVCPQSTKEARPIRFAWDFQEGWENL